VQVLGCQGRGRTEAPQHRRAGRAGCTAGDTVHCPLSSSQRTWPETVVVVWGAGCVHVGGWQRDAGSEAVGCATMILVRGEPSWAEVIRNASQDALVGKVTLGLLVVRVGGRGVRL
jgi:uncharacterized Zn-binding protein involved in type VI secretion